MPPVDEGRFRAIFDAAPHGIIILDPRTGHVVETSAEGCRMHGYARDAFIGLPWTEFVHPDSRAALLAAIEASAAGHPSETQVRHIRLDGSTFSGEWYTVALADRGKVRVLATVSDVSARILEAESVHQEVETRKREQAVLLEISRRLATVEAVQPTLILDLLRDVLAFDRGGLFAVEGAALVLQSLSGTSQLRSAGPRRTRLQTGDTDLLLNLHRPLQHGDERFDSAMGRGLHARLTQGAALVLGGCRSWIWLPLVVKGRLNGGLLLARDGPEPFSAHQADLAQSAANQAAIFLVNADLHVHAKALAVLQERQRLAQNLHDAVNQSLFSAGLIAEVLPRLWERDQAGARRSLQDLRRLMRNAQDEMRALLAELRPAVLADSDLGNLIRVLAKTVISRDPVAVSLDVAPGVILPAAVHETFYRICQEALSNVVKHARAHTATISLKWEGSVAELRIRDDGVGFSHDAAAAGHFGLIIMRERADAVGAALAIDSQPGHGTVITLRWSREPLEEDL